MMTSYIKGAAESIFTHIRTPQRGFGIYILTPVLFVPKSDELMR